MAQTGGPADIAARAVEQLQQARRTMDAAQGSRNRIAALTETVRAYEAGLQALREGMRRASAREGDIRARFDRESTGLSRLLAVLQTASGGPEAAFLLHPGGPLGTARAGMILSDVTPALLARVDVLRGDLKEIATLRALQESAAQTLGEGLDGVQEARTALSLAMSNRIDLPKRLTEDPEQMQRLIDSAETLEGFAKGLAALPDDDIAADMPDFAAAKGDLALPAPGRVVTRFRKADAAGIARPGLTLATPPGALVTTPWPATIRYRGPLLDYANVMILEPSAGYLLVLAGLDRVYGETGQVIPADTPIGLMAGGSAADLAGFGADGAKEDGQTRQESLYIELRKGQTPVDPSAWFRMDEE